MWPWFSSRGFRYLERHDLKCVMTFLWFCPGLIGKHMVYVRVLFLRLHDQVVWPGAWFWRFTQIASRMMIWWSPQRFPISIPIFCYVSLPQGFHDVEFLLLSNNISWFYDIDQVMMLGSIDIITTISIQHMVNHIHLISFNHIFLWSHP